MSLTAKEVQVAIELIERSPITGAEAKATAVTLHKLEALLQTLQDENTDGDNANITE